ncbi:outer membrane beta-barrel protein [Kaarinaea lacus]
MNIKYTIAPVALFWAFLFSNTAVAGSDSGFYLGGSIGQSTIKGTGQDPTSGDFTFNEQDAGYKIFAGYNFGIIPLIDLAVEGSYVDFGNPSTSIPGVGSVELGLTGWDAFGLGALTFGPFSVFGKMGLISWDSDSSLGGSDSGSDPAYGLGAKFILGSLAIRAEYEYFDINELSDLYMLSAGVSWTF